MWTWEQLRREQLSASGQLRLLPQPYPSSGQRHALAAAVGAGVMALQGPTRLLLELGGRFHPHWDALQPDGSADGAAFATVHLPWALHGGLTLVDAKERWQLQLTYATGYRVPSWQAQAGTGTQGSSFWRPNPQLRPEFNHNIEARLVLQWRRRVRFELRSFVQLWHQMIGLKPAQHQGQRQVGALPVVQHANHDALRPFVGVEGVAWVRIWRGWSAKASVTGLHLFDAAMETTPLHIWPAAPPLSARFATRYQFGRWGGIEAAIQVMAGQQTRLAPSTLRLLLEQKNPTYAPWTTFTVRADLRLTRHLVANLENLSHQPYLRFGSLIYAPGIHYRFQLVARW